jgi:hypothetical protein
LPPTHPVCFSARILIHHSLSHPFLLPNFIGVTSRRQSREDPKKIHHSRSTCRDHSRSWALVGQDILQINDAVEKPKEERNGETEAEVKLIMKLSDITHLQSPFH